MAHLRTPTLLAPAALALLLGFPPRAGGQGQTRDTTRASAGAKDLPLSAAQRQAFVGTYAVTLPHGEQTSVRIFEENGQLKAQPENQPALRLLYQGDNVFRPEGVSDFTLTFALENGRATRFTGRRPDGVMEGTRVP